VKLSFIKDISIMRLSGIKSIIVLEMFQDHYKVLLVKRKEGPFRLKKGDLKSFQSVYSDVCYADAEPSGIQKKIKEIISKYGLKDPALVAGVNGFRHSMAAIPLDNDDEELWFLENSGKFLPEGRPKDEFILSYGLLRKDDNYAYYLTSVLRRDYMDKVLSILKLEGLKILGVFPFRLLLPFNGFTRDKNLLYLEILQSEIAYSFTSESGSFTSGVEYLEAIENGKLNSSGFEGALNNIREVLRQASGQNPLNELHLLLSSEKDVFSEAEPIARQVFSPAEINNSLHGLDLQFLSSGLALNTIFNGMDSGINFLDEERKEKEREPVEKLAAMRLILAFGGILIFFLLSFYMLEGYMSDKLQNMGDDLSGASTRLIEVEKLTKENASLALNLKTLKSLKTERVTYTNLMFYLSGITSEKSCLTGLTLKGKQGDFIDCDISGAARTQEEVARVMGRLETLQGFKDPVLLFSGEKERAYSEAPQMDGLMRFNISIKYKAE
jgi:hypothetical protein